MKLVNRTRDEIVVGETAELRRRLTAGDLFGFATVSGNINPMHLPGEESDGSGHRGGAARVKGGVAGHASILVVPGIDAGNMLAKQLSFISHAEGAGLMLGAKVPVILNSRSDSPMSRLASCAVAALNQAAKGALA